MSRHFKVACVQHCADTDLQANIVAVSRLVEQAHGDAAQLICLPEYFAYIAPDDQTLLEQAFSEETHPAIPHFRSLARDLGVWILMGSLPIKINATQVNNRSYLLNDQGGIVATYNKIHLFDVNLRDGECYKESTVVRPGDQAVLAQTPWGLLGMTICYDLRFAYLYRHLAQSGASFIAVPAAFTKTTGEAHWHVLQRARAIETGCYLFAPCQNGVRSTGRATYGHSLIIDPWGKVLADGGDGPGYITAEIDLAKVREARQMVPSLEHDSPLRGFAQEGTHEIQD